MRKLTSAIMVCFSLAAFAAPAPADRAPDFGWDAAGGSLNSLKTLRGHSVCLLVAKSPKNKDFREQVSRLEAIYQDFASRKVVFTAAFYEDADGRIPSNIPIAVASNGQQVIADYGVKDALEIIVISPDGNIEMRETKVVPASRVRDMAISNSAEQTDERNPAPPQ